MFGSVVHHAAELQAREHVVVPARSSLTEKNGPSTLKPDAQRREQKKRTGDDQHCGRHGDVGEAFGYGAPTRIGDRLDDHRKGVADRPGEGAFRVDPIDAERNVDEDAFPCEFAQDGGHFRSRHLVARHDDPEYSDLSDVGHQPVEVGDNAAIFIDKVPDRAKVIGVADDLDGAIAVGLGHEGRVPSSLPTADNEYRPRQAAGPSKPDKVASHDLALDRHHYERQPDHYHAPRPWWRLFDHKSEPGLDQKAPEQPVDHLGHLGPVGGDPAGLVETEVREAQQAYGHEHQRLHHRDLGKSGQPGGWLGEKHQRGSERHSQGHAVPGYYQQSSATGSLNGWRWWFNAAP